ncbi:BadF/BadG/BcrA/BcrD ATPase family protein [uncultured Bacteroides sp.]|uniref:BadF/BadG/BcrA/BcrD ATPase family protein n=1 Tax=uncultured Bacteroides sp. TaxID=162156 RepID=UPI002AA716F3|nr:BadF/BadG/BcrA/BcrD ATPase family protein [uncultured Bacteroides sp.]
MILIADSGSTKTDWCIVDKGQLVQQVYTKGTNPFFQSEEEISNEVGNALLPQIGSYTINALYFYGAGCGFPDKIEAVHRAISQHINAKIEVNTDMLAAARGLCGHRPGIACILGTGSNSCFYDGENIVDNVSPLGFILGDEGSGAVLGKLLVGDILKNQITPALKEKFLTQFNLTPGDIIDRVYRQPFPNRFLASLSPFLIQNIQEPEIHTLILDSFKAFFKRNVMQYDYQNNKVHIIGSVAHHYKEILIEAAAQMDIKLGTVIKSPMKGLIEYHK